MRTPPLLVLLVLAATACTSIPRDEAPASGPLSSGNLNRLGAAATGLDAVQQLRPQWLATCDGCADPMVVFRLGGWQALDDPRSAGSPPAAVDALGHVRVGDITRMEVRDRVRIQGHNYRGRVIVVYTTSRYP